MLICGTQLLMTRNSLLALALILSFSGAQSLTVLSACAKDKVIYYSPLSDDNRKSLEKAMRFVKAKKKDKAKPIFDAALAECTDVQKCFALADMTEQYGSPLTDLRRAAVEKAYSLSKSRDDLILVALKGRKFECFEVTRDSIQEMITQAKTREDLKDLALKAQEVSLADLAHLAMEKQYSFVQTVPDAIDFCRQASALGMDDMVRKTAKELIDDESDVHQLMTILRHIEPFKTPDLYRYLLKKSLDNCKNIDDLYEVYQAARRHRQKDIFDVAAFRAKKYKLQENFNKQNADYHEKLERWRQDQSMNREMGEMEGDITRMAPASGF